MFGGSGRERHFPHSLKSAAAFLCPLKTVAIKCILPSLDYLGETSRFVTAANSIVCVRYKQTGHGPPQAEDPRKRLYIFFSLGLNYRLVSFH